MGYLNPLEKLSALSKLQALPAAERKALRAEFQALRAACDALAHQSWNGKKRRHDDASFWRASATYARHLAVGISREKNQLPTKRRVT
jgi:hypothetical protein